MIQDLLAYAKQYVNTPYIWGGDNPLKGFDCSGYIQWVLASVGYDPIGDQTSQALYNHFKQNANGIAMDSLRPASLIFYGKGHQKITHIGMGINEITVIEAGRGGRNIKTVQDAVKKGACVREINWDYRSDAIGILMPKYRFL